MYRRVFWTLWERARENGIETCILYMWNESPVQDRCMIQDSWGWYTGMTQRDGLGREVGGGFRLGTRVHLGGFMLMYRKTNAIL